MEFNEKEKDTEEKKTAQEDLERSAEEVSSIFCPAKSRKELQDAEKAKREETKKRAKSEREEARKNRKNQPKSRDAVLWTTVGIFAAVILVVGVIVLIQVLGGGSGVQRVEREGSGHFYDSTALPEMSADGIKSAVTEAYYTTDGALAVHLKFSNAYPTPQRLTSLDVTIRNGEEEVIAAGATTEIDKNYRVPAEGYSDFIFYIPLKYVKIEDDPLTTLSYVITTEGEKDDPDATVSPQYATVSEESDASGTTAATAS